MKKKDDLITDIVGAIAAILIGRLMK